MDNCSDFDSDDMSLIYEFKKNEEFLIDYCSKMNTEYFVKNIVANDKNMLDLHKQAGYLTQFVVARNYKLRSPLLYDRFDTFDFSIYNTTVDIKSSTLKNPSLIVALDKYKNADVFILFAVDKSKIVCMGGITKKRIEENLSSQKIIMMNNKEVIMIPEKELTDIIIDKLGVNDA